MKGTLPTSILTGITLNGKTWRLVATKNLDKPKAKPWDQSVWNTEDVLTCDETGQTVTITRKKLIEKINQYQK